MSAKVKKKEFIRALAQRMNTDEQTAEQWVEAYTDTLLAAFSRGEGVTIDGLGGFYVDNRGNSTAFKFNPSQRLRSLLGWSSTYGKR
jgi:DNA-binding protein HU-beta